jgi:uncharacterized protein YrrD
MHVRFSTVIGLPVVEESGEEELASVSGILIHPDMGKVEGFFVRAPGFFQSKEHFVSVMDIIHWGNRVRVRGPEALSSLEDLVRLQALSQEGRTVLGQKIITEDGTPLGICKDVQFDTVSFYMEWLFPKRMMTWGRAIPVTSIVEVKPDAIVVRDAVTIPEPIDTASVLSTLDPLVGTTAQRVMQRKKR